MVTGPPCDPPVEAVASSTPETESCSICLEALSEKDAAGTIVPVLTVECSHTFHAHCLLSYCRRNQTTCPLCRAEWVSTPLLFGVVPTAPAVGNPRTSASVSASASAVFTDPFPVPVTIPTAPSFTTRFSQNMYSDCNNFSDCGFVQSQSRQRMTQLFAEITGTPTYNGSGHRYTEPARSSARPVARTYQAVLDHALGRTAGPTLMNVVYDMYVDSSLTPYQESSFGCDKLE